MQQELSLKTALYQVRHKHRRAWKRVLWILSSVVVFVTTYALILPAITMEPAYICGMEAHVHSEDCYRTPEVTAVSTLICTPDGLGLHEHTNDCYNENGEPKCGIADFVLHSHDPACFDTNGELVCSLPEITAHTHGNACWHQPHVHADTCYVLQRGELLCAAEEGSVHTHLDTCFGSQENLICTLPEITPHTHTEACFAETRDLLCTEAEVVPHTHSDGCYTEETTQICTEEPSENHTHTEACFQTTLVFTCILEETAGHSHSEACYTEPVYTLICTTEETEGHTHSSACYETVRVVQCALEENLAHVHTDACFVCTPVLQCEELTAEEGAVPVLICEKEELFPHTHEAACFDPNGRCVCGLLQVSEHIHGDACFVITQGQATEPVLACGLEAHEHDETCIAKEEADNTISGDSLIAEGYYCGVAEHSHGFESGCFTENDILMCSMTEHQHTWICALAPSDFAAVETARDWEATLPKLQGDIAADLIAVAESQLGYEQSEVNYIIENEEQLFYSRYGAWWDEEDPYGDWNAKFVSFCLDYAGITDVPLEPDTAAWPDMLKSCGQWHENNGRFLPISADLVFFDDDGNDEADCVGILGEVSPEDELMTVILEGNGKVRQRNYALDDADIVGYARIPGNEPAEELSQPDVMYYCGHEEHTHQVTCLDADGDLICETAEHIHDSRCLNVVAQIFTDGTYRMSAEHDTTVITITGDLPADVVVKAFPVELDAEENAVLAYDITIFRADGTIFEPDADDVIHVTIQSGSLLDTGDMELEVCHVPDGGEPEPIEATVTEGQVFFETNHFSVYMVRAVEPRAVTGIATYEQLQEAIDGSDPVIVLGANMNYGVATIGIPAGKAVILDLNGFTIRHQGNGPLFSVPAGTSLTIIDSARNVHGNTAAAVEDQNEITLTYYVTESSLTQGTVTGATTETLQEYTVTGKGTIIGTNQPIVSVSGGTFELRGGMLYGGTNRAVYQTNGVTTLSGGYICGFENSGNGGAVYSNGGTLNISGTVLAGNEATRGGAVYTNSTEVTISGGVVSGNTSTYNKGSGEWETHYGGGGFYLNGSPAVMTGGYVTNNVANATGYFDGGGGILVCGGNMPFTLKGGYITGNIANSGGGIRTNWQNSVELTMEGGFVCSNIAKGAEGGGISLNMGGTGLVTGGYINNNRTEADQHWGGGGLFGSTGSNLYIRNVLITDNHAGGFGGGIGGCSTGRVYVCVTEGAAVYDNSALGQNTSGGASTKNEDHIYALNNEIFMNNGYQDYFCALNSVVEGGMLGGYPANWTGSADGAVVRASKEDTLIAAYVMGLNSAPTQAAKAAATGEAKVFISGNDSYTHGGGVLCNGYMIIGETDHIEAGARIELQAQKELLSSNSEKQKMTDGQFTFHLIDAQTGAVLATASNDKDGNIQFKERIPFFSTGTFVYYIQEVPGKDGRVVYDSTVYRLTVDVTSEREHFDTIQVGTASIDIDRTQYLLDALTVDKRNGGDEWIRVSRNDNPSNSDDSAIKLQLTSDATFTNVKRDDIDIEVKKLWVDEDSPNRPDSVTVWLLQNKTRVNPEVVLNSGNGWHHVWNDLPTVGEDGTTYTYTVTEDPVPGYLPEYEVTTNNAKTGYWIPATSIEVGERYAIISPDHKYALYMTDEKANADLTTNEKREITAESVTIDGVTYEYAIPDGELHDRSIFHAGTNNDHNNERTILRNLGINGNSWLLAEDKDKDGNWLKGCNNADYASGVIYENGISIQRQWDKNNERRYLTFANGKFNSSENSGGNNALLYRYVYAGNITSSSLVQITNRSTGVVTYALDITKISGINPNLKLAGAEFQLRNSDSTVLSFVKAAPGAYDMAPDSAAGAVQTLVTNGEGKLVLRGLNAGTYTLRETKAPADHMPIEDMKVTLGEPDDTGQVSLTLPLTIVDAPISYELPETGGMGTTVFYIVGSIMVAAAAVLLVAKKRMGTKG